MMASDQPRVLATLILILLPAAAWASVSIFDDLHMVRSDFPSVHAEKLIRQLNLFPREELNVVGGRGRLRRQELKKFVDSAEVPFEVDGSEAGLMKTYGTLTFLKVHDAGHMLVQWTQGKLSPTGDDSVTLVAEI